MLNKQNIIIMVNELQENTETQELLNDGWKPVKDISWLKDYFNMKLSTYSKIGKTLTIISNDMGFPPKKIKVDDDICLKIYSPKAIDKLYKFVKNDNKYLIEIRNLESMNNGYNS